MAEKILLVEDEDNIRKFTKINIEREGYEVLEAASGEEGVEIALKEKPDLAVLDIMLPGMNGLEVCRILRQSFPSIGIIMLTAKTQENDTIEGLQSGADDYLKKPFNPKELILRIQSILRRIGAKEREDVIVNEPFRLDMYAKKLYKNDREIFLTPTELSIIMLFMKTPGKAFSRSELLDLNWGEEFVGDMKIVDVNIRRLRSKIEDNSSKPKYIETVWGIGYRWRKN